MSAELLQGLCPACGQTLWAVEDGPAHAERWCESRCDDEDILAAFAAVDAEEIDWASL